MNRRVELNRGNRIFLACVYWTFVLYVFVPLLLMIVMGFKDSKFIGFPIRTWTLDWYTGVFANTEVLSTLGYSLAIAVLATLISVAVGTWIAVLLEGRKFLGRTAMFGLTVLPALVPGIISAIAFRVYARWLGIEPGMGAIVWAHAVHNVPFVALVVMVRAPLIFQRRFRLSWQLRACLSLSTGTAPLPRSVAARIYSKRLVFAWMRRTRCCVSPCVS